MERPEALHGNQPGLDRTSWVPEMATQKTDLQRVETGQKAWTEDYDPYLKIYTKNRQYHVDNGFLINKQRIEELARAIRGNSF